MLIKLYHILQTHYMRFISNITGFLIKIPPKWNPPGFCQEETLLPACKPIYEKMEMKITWVSKEKAPKANNWLQIASGKSIKNQNNKGFTGQDFSPLSRKSFTELLNVTHKLNGNAFRWFISISSALSVFFWEAVDDKNYYNNIPKTVAEKTEKVYLVSSLKHCKTCHWR